MADDNPFESPRADLSPVPPKGRTGRWFFQPFHPWTIIIVLSILALPVLAVILGILL